MAQALVAPKDATDRSGQRESRLVLVGWKKGFARTADGGAC